ncbi:MAG: hypothetical protein ACP5XB_07770 [Isosphaeraceae bacterium]
MATVAERGGKTSFVRDYLLNQPRGNHREINEAWTAAGFEGTISKPVVDKMRAKLKLTGNLGMKTKRTAQTSGSAKRKRSAATTPGKASFTKEFLNDHPEATSRDVNEAWARAGMLGTISHTVVSEVRKSLGLNGKAALALRKQAASATVPPSTPQARRPGLETARAASVATRTTAQDTSRAEVLLAAEEQIDRLIFQMMGLGELTEIETALREARRAVYRALTS